MPAHTAYVVASYAAAFAVVAALVLWVLIDARMRRREMRALEAAGIRRRSQSAGTPT